MTDRTVSDHMADARMLGKWIRCLDRDGDEWWYRSVEDLVANNWVVFHAEREDASHLIPSEAVRARCNRMETIELRDHGPDAIEGDQNERD